MTHTLQCKDKGLAMHDDPCPGSIPAAAEERAAREAFESVMRLKPLVRRETGEYLSEYTQEDWQLWLVAWQARAALAAPKAEAWRPIETAPEGVWILVRGATSRTNADVLVVRRFAGEWWESADDGYGAHIEPTHWMPLPAPPTSPAPQEKTK